MIGWLRKLFSRPVRPRKDAKVYDMSEKCFWGDSVRWHDIPTHRIVGWCEPLPQVGDIVKSPMRSGRVGMFVVVKVEPCGNPHDMFFGTVAPFQYEEQPG